jgi:hypothetical protein
MDVDGRREVLVLDDPCARGADVLETNHADGLAEAADRDVEHGGDAEWDEVGLGECAGARIEARVVSGDHPFRLDGLEVDRVARRVQLGAAGVNAGRALEHLIAADRFASRGVEPDADALDLERLRPGHGDVAQRLDEIAAMDRRPARELHECAVVTAQTAFGLADQRLHMRRGSRAEGRGLGHGGARASPV